MHASDIVYLPECLSTLSVFCCRPIHVSLFFCIGSSIPNLVHSDFALFLRLMPLLTTWSSRSMSFPSVYRGWIAPMSLENQYLLHSEASKPPMDQMLQVASARFPRRNLHESRFLSETSTWRWITHASKRREARLRKSEIELAWGSEVLFNWFDGHLEHKRSAHAVRPSLPEMQLERGKEAKRIQIESAACGWSDKGLK